MVFVKNILVDHIRLFGGSKNEVKMEFLWKWCKKYKNKMFVFCYQTWVCGQDLRSYTYFEGPGRRYLSENHDYQQLSGEKKGGNAPESDEEISKFVFYVLQSYLKAWLKF